MKILFDTNILLDVFLEREGLYEGSVILLDYVVKGKIEGWLSGVTITTAYYLLSKALSRKDAENYTATLFEIFQICNVNRLVLVEALKSGFKDYEDAVQYQSALHSGLNGILTRNKKDFKKSNMPVYTPNELLKAIENLK